MVKPGTLLPILTYFERLFDNPLNRIAPQSEAWRLRDGSTFGEPP
jgi:hypothetical protein